MLRNVHGVDVFKASTLIPSCFCACNTAARRIFLISGPSPSFFFFGVVLLCVLTCSYVYVYSFSGVVCLELVFLCVFLSVFLQWGFFLCFFPLVDVGQRPPKFVLCLDAPPPAPLINILSDAMTLSGVHNKHHYHIIVIAWWYMCLYLVRCMLGACSGSAVTIKS